MAAKVNAVAIFSLLVVTACAASSDPSDPATQEGEWDAQSATNETDSTHLWIVDRAIDVLGRHPEDETATRAFTLLNEPTCRTSWQQGLLDADFKAAYNNGHADLPVPASNANVLFAGSSWESHFFDPDTMKNYKGEVRPTALTESKAHLDAALARALDVTEGCYELGLALHYYTDVTQPMHAANFTFKNRPVGLHTSLESYAVEIQGRFPLADWSGAPTTDLDTWFMKTAIDAKALHPENMRAVADAYRASRAAGVSGCGDVDATNVFERQFIDRKRCWEANPGVDAAVGKSLQQAQDYTAKYLWLVVDQLPRVDVVE